MRTPRAGQWASVVLVSLVPATLLVAALYELVVALVGTTSSGWAEAAGALAMVLGFLVAAVHVFLRRPRRVVALYAPAAAAVATASFYTYDPYYAPSSRRYSDGGAVSPVWILGMVALSLAVGASTLRSPRVGSAATALFLPVLLVTWVLALDGH